MTGKLLAWGAVHAATTPLPAGVHAPVAVIGLETLMTGQSHVSDVRVRTLRQRGRMGCALLDNEYAHSCGRKGDLMTAPQVLGRRERNMQLKHERIFAAAAELFAERGFAAATTQEVADRAGVAAGTVFRYAASKSELLLMIYNRMFREAIAEGVGSAARPMDAVDAVQSIVMAVFDASMASPENSAAYQRELLFGPASERYRAEGLAIVAEMEDTIATRLLAAAPEMDADSARLTAASVFAVLHLGIARSSTQAHPGRDARQDLHDQVHLILAGPASSKTLAGANQQQKGNQR